MMNKIPKFSDELGPMTVVPAVWDALSAASARSVGVTHLFLSGAAHNNVHGYPDRGLLDIEDICRTVKEITSATGLPILVDAEAGFGGLPRFARLLDELIRSGCTAIMIEDQDEAGQSKSLMNPGLCDPEVMLQRMELIKSIVGDELEVLARTDYLPGMDFEDSLERLELYSKAGADWLVPVFAPSRDAVKAAAEQFAGRLFVLSASPPINGAMRYAPTYADLQELNPIAIKVTGQYRNVVPLLQQAYRQSVDGEWEALFGARPDPIWLDEMLGLNRPGMDL
jgi:2-methylisocitrate lyase-like PEP mutase family enzyme